MAKYKEYKVISDRWIEPLIPLLNQESKDGWSVTYMLQEHAVTKIVLEREING